MLRFLRISQMNYRFWLTQATVLMLFVMTTGWFRVGFDSVNNMLMLITVWALLSIIYYIRTRPHDYIDLFLGDSYLNFISRFRSIIIRASHIQEVSLERREALFDDLGQYVETVWIVRLKQDKTVEIPADWLNRRRLNRWFSRKLPGYNSMMANQVFSSDEKDLWCCFKRTSSS